MGVQIKFDSTKGVGEISEHMYMHLYTFFILILHIIAIFSFALLVEICHVWIAFGRFLSCDWLFCIKSPKYTCASHFRSKHMVLFCRSFLRKMQVG